ncbi:hypothetical protein EAF04_005426 [Stromatinia cepivora]|nr:hypothetical protein EAF04_005426 [Stromatinia cepivora]
MSHSKRTARLVPPGPKGKATTKTTKATKSKLSTKKKNTVNPNEEAPQPEAHEPTVTNPVDRIYKTVTLESDDIEDGLWMMRKLGNGKYEAVNLNTISHEDLCSEENEARMASHPESVNVFEASQKSLGDITMKLDRAVFAASGKVFRLKKLPIELRYKIYEFALISYSGLIPSNLPFDEGCKQPGLALGLVASCRYINAECVQFFWKNTFNLSATTIKLLRESKQTLIQNARNLKCEWSGIYSKDSFIFGLLASCAHLETLEIVLQRSCVSDGQPTYYHRKVQRLHQADNSIRKFNKSNGFDKLISLHDLKKVTVSKHWTLELDKTLTETEFKNFEQFLIKKLTTPVAPPVVFTQLPSTPARKSTRIQKLENLKPIKYVPDPVSDDEEDSGNEADDNDEDDEDDDGQDVMSIAYIT